MGDTRQDPDARMSFSKPTEASLTDGSARTKKLSLKELLLTSEARTDTLTPPRPERRHRAPLDLE